MFFFFGKIKTGDGEGGGSCFFYLGGGESWKSVGNQDAFFGGRICFTLVGEFVQYIIVVESFCPVLVKSVILFKHRRTKNQSDLIHHIGTPYPVIAQQAGAG